MGFDGIMQLTTLTNDYIKRLDFTVQWSLQFFFSLEVHVPLFVWRNFYFKFKAEPQTQTEKMF